MSPDYLLRAKSDLRVAKLVLGSDDDYDLLIAAYHVQQAVEKTLKLTLKELGVPYTKTRRIEDLLSRLPDNQNLLGEEWLDWLETNSATFCDWESKTRYVEGYSVTRRHVLRLYNDSVRLVAEFERTLQALYEVSAREQPKRSLSHLDLGGGFITTF